MANLKSLALIMAAMAVGFSSASIQAAPGDTLPDMWATFVDNANKNTYHIHIGAQEYGAQAGSGDVLIQLGGPHLHLVTVNRGNLNHKPPIGSQPLAAMTAGAAGSQAVDIGAQVVQISAHAFMHSDAPNNIVFIGPVTADVRIQKNSGQIRVVIYAPKGQITLQGPLSVTP